MFSTVLLRPRAVCIVKTVQPARIAVLILPRRAATQWCRPGWRCTGHPAPARGRKTPARMSSRSPQGEPRHCLKVALVSKRSAIAPGVTFIIKMLTHVPRQVKVGRVRGSKGPKAPIYTRAWGACKWGRYLRPRKRLPRVTAEKPVRRSRRRPLQIRTHHGSFAHAKGMYYATACQHIQRRVGCIQAEAGRCTILPDIKLSGPVALNDKIFHVDNKFCTLIERKGTVP